MKDGQAKFNAAVSVIESVLRLYWEEVERNGESARSDGDRARLWGLKCMLEALEGPQFKQRVLNEVRQRTGRGIPHTGERVGDNRIGFMADRDEGYLGFDSDADF